MYERVWEGTAPGLDGAEWDLSLDFNQETGLFRCSGSVGGGSPEVYECADPVVSGFMARSENDRPDDPEMMALIPPAPLEMQGRFAPFSSPEQIVSGTWRTPRAWPEPRKDETVRELLFRRTDIVRLADRVNPNRLAIMECSRLLNGMYGDPTRWPRRAIDIVLDYPRGTELGDKYYAGLNGYMLPPEFSDVVVRTGSALKGKALGHRDAVYALYEKAKSNGLFIEQGWEDHFGVVPSVNAGQFIRELSEGDTVTLSLAASFNSFGGRTLELGDIQIQLESADWYRDKIKYCGFSYGPIPLDVHNLGKLPLDEFGDYLLNCSNFSLYELWAGAFLDGEYGVDIDEGTDRVLISAKAIAEGAWEDDDDGLLRKNCTWKVVSWSKSENVYHVETWMALKYHEIGLSGTDHAQKLRDDTYESFPSQFMADMHTMPMVMDGVEPAAFVNARYAIDPDRLLRGHFHEGARNKTVPGTAALKENLVKLDQKAKVNQSPKNESRGWHV